VIVFEDLDELARGLAENDLSRRQAIEWVGYSVLGAALSSMGFAESAEALTARQRRRCRRKGGIPLEKGNCNCGFRCDAPNPNQFTCQNHPGCACLKTTEGKGFCTQRALCEGLQECSSSSQCPSGFKCSATCCPGEPLRCVPACGLAALGAQQPAASRGAMTTNGRPSGG
jgi:hypothetical protein